MAVVELETSCPLWIVWFLLLGYLKVFGGLSRDRFDRLCASPTASVWAHVRAFTVSLLVLAADLFWYARPAVLPSPSHHLEASPCQRNDFSDKKSRSLTRMPMLMPMPMHVFL